MLELSYIFILSILSILSIIPCQVRLVLSYCPCAHVEDRGSGYPRAVHETVLDILLTCNCAFYLNHRSIKINRSVWPNMDSFEKISCGQIWPKMNKLTRVVRPSTTTHGFPRMCTPKKNPTSLGQVFLSSFWGGVGWGKGAPSFC